MSQSRLYSQVLHQLNWEGSSSSSHLCLHTSAATNSQTVSERIVLACCVHWPPQDVLTLCFPENDDKRSPLETRPGETKTSVEQTRRSWFCQRRLSPPQYLCSTHRYVRDLRCTKYYSISSFNLLSAPVLLDWFHKWHLLVWYQWVNDQQHTTIAFNNERRIRLHQ